MANGPQLKSELRGGESVLQAKGDWTVAHAADLGELAQNFPLSGRSMLIDVRGVDALDTFGAWAIEKLRLTALRRGAEVRLSLPRNTQPELLQQLDAVLARSQPRKDYRAAVRSQLAVFGTRAAALITDAGLFLSLFGQVCLAFQRGIRHPTRFRLRSVVHHMDRVGVQAVPIIALMTFLIGCIIAQQGFFHFQRFGARDYVVDLVTILVLREIGVLLVIIMIAGRSGSAYTAEIGSMKMREEIDALRTMGLDPVEYLILPRILALVLAAPLITLVGNAMALIGAGVVAAVYGDMTSMVFVDRLHEAASYIDLEVGLIKAPVMALVIGVVSSLQGMKVQGSTESLGQETTASVVRSIFLVIVLDGIFAVLFASAGM